ncbi:MAG: EAL domain-containing protein [Mesorhizobium sp.]|nr:EAL domain-containing protein [Mesorhizobium sp.]
MTRPLTVNHAITIDEVGIETGHYRCFHLKSAYQPIWLHRDGMLHPNAVEGLIRPFVDGNPVPVSELFESVPAHDRLFVETLCRALHLRNHHNVDVPELDLFFNFDPRVHDDMETAIELLAIMAHRLTVIGLDIGRLVCEITESAELDCETFACIATEIRRLGMRLAIDDFGNGHSTLERVELIKPDIVKIDGAWFRRVAGAPGAARLLGTLVKGFHAMGISVLVEGVETPRQLATAIDAGAERAQGYLLGRPALAGTAFDPAPRPVAHFLGQTGNVVPLPGRRRR